MSPTKRAFRLVANGVQLSELSDIYETFSLSLVESALGRRPADLKATGLPVVSVRATDLEGVLPTVAGEHEMESHLTPNSKS